MVLLNRPLTFRWMSFIIPLLVCLATGRIVCSESHSSIQNPAEKVFYRVSRSGSLTVLSLFSQAELPRIQHEILSNQEGLVLHLSRQVEFRPEEPQKAGPLVVVPSESDEGTSVLVLSAEISGISRTVESKSQISYWIATKEAGVAKYYDERARVIGAALTDPQTKVPQEAEEKAKQTGPLSPLPQTSSGPKGRPPKSGPSPQGANHFELPPRLTLTGSAAAGYFHATNEDGFTTTRDTVLNNLRLDLSGYLHDPRFLSFEVKPQLSLGRQTTEAVLPDGQGVALSATFLGGGNFPLTISYTTLRRELITFGVLDRLAGLEADSSQSSLGVNWELKFPRLPQFTFSFSRYGDSYTPLQPLTSQIENHSRIFSAQVKDQRWGWDWNSEFRVEGMDEDLLNVFSPTQTPFRFTRHSKELRASASREYSSWLGVNVFAGHSTSQNEVASHPFDQDFTYLNGNVHFGLGKKLSGMVRGGVVSNLVGFQLAQALPSSPGQSATALPSSGATLFETTQAKSTLFTLSGQLQYQLTRDLRLDGQLTDNLTHAPPLQTGFSPDTKLLALWGGPSYSHHSRWWQFQARYARAVGQFNYGNISRSRWRGDEGNISITVGSPQRIEVTLSGLGNRQRTTGDISLDNRDYGGGISVTRTMLLGWNLRASYNLDRNFFDTNTSRFDSTIQSWSAGFSHRRIDLSFSRQVRQGLTFQPDLRLGIASLSQARTLVAAFPTIVAIPSNFYWTGATASIVPVKRMTGRFSWGRNQQLLFGGTQNHYFQWEATLGYQFRLLNVDFGYINHEQDFGPSRFARNRIFVRVVREFQVF